jgi:tartrate dehydrogenase/decarboxylase/D-malate dehydrogenase
VVPEGVRVLDETGRRFGITFEWEQRPWGCEYYARTGEMMPSHGLRMDTYHIDILAAHFVLRPNRSDVVVASNLFGDILSNLGSACAGTIGIAPSANLNPERNLPSMFEPVHGSAPDIFGRNIPIPSGRSGPGL